MGGLRITIRLILRWGLLAMWLCSTLGSIRYRVVGSFSLACADAVQVLEAVPDWVLVKMDPSLAQMLQLKQVRHRNVIWLQETTLEV